MDKLKSVYRSYVQRNLRCFSYKLRRPVEGSAMAADNVCKWPIGNHITFTSPKIKTNPHAQNLRFDKPEGVVLVVVTMFCAFAELR